MKVLILGATGGTGQQLVTQALQQNHEVTALARHPSRLKHHHEGLTIVHGDVLDKDILAKSLEGKDAVLSALGVGKSLKSGNLISDAVSILIPAMNEKHVRRLIFLSAFGVGETFKQADFIQRIIYKLFLKNIYADKSKGDDLIRHSPLDWILVYPVLMTDAPGTGKYKAGEKMEMKGIPKVPRADVAEFMVQQLNENTYLRKSAIVMS
ncbi:SDR family oxidoreductase [Pollutibacter soli]|uniref:NAD(P)-dependent oxidoreductase n=1 Tax=Pollutibacter soli TaxID=3034157 RepID=UPI003013976F